MFFRRTANALFNDGECFRGLRRAEHRYSRFLFELAAGLGHPALRLLSGFALLGARENFLHRFAPLRLEVLERGLQSLLDLFELGGLLLLPFLGERLFTRRQRLLLFAKATLRLSQTVDALVQFVQKARNVALLGGHALARVPDQPIGQAQAAGDLETGRFARRAQPQNISRLQRLLVETHRGVDDSRGG